MECLCGEEIHPNRIVLGYEECLKCGEIKARQKKFCIVPLHKSNYIVLKNKEDLKGLNKSNVCI